MTSATTISTIVIEPDTTQSNDLTNKEKFVKRFPPPNSKPNKKSKKQKEETSIIRPLQANDIKEHRLWSLGSLILCFFLIAPCFAFYHSRRIRKMKNNQELTRAQALSARVSNILVISTIIGLVVWVVILFVIGVLCIFGAVY